MKRLQPNTTAEIREQVANYVLSIRSDRTEFVVATYTISCTMYYITVCFAYKLAHRYDSFFWRLVI